MLPWPLMRGAASLVWAAWLARSFSLDKFTSSTFVCVLIVLFAGYVLHVYGVIPFRKVMEGRTSRVLVRSRPSRLGCRVERSQSGEDLITGYIELTK